jgi:hypothetical protein
MRVAFRSTLDEAVEVQMLILDRYRSLRSNRWKMAIVGTLIAGLIACAGTAVFLPGLHWSVQVAAGAVAGLFGGINCYLTYRAMVVRNLRKICREQRGTGGALPVCIEIDDRGVHAHLKDTHVISAWTKVREIEERDGAVIFWMGDLSVVAARNRGFASHDERDEFVALARRYHRRALDAVR